MDLDKNGKLLKLLRQSKGMTQKDVADCLGVLPKTVSKWETGHGFPDISYIAELSEILGVSTDTLLSGELVKNIEEVGNMKNFKFYVCPHCTSLMQGTGSAQVVCCGELLEPLAVRERDAEHEIVVSQTDNEFYITINHEMTKEHYIAFVAYVSFDRVMTVRLYPEQDSSVHFPKMHGGKIYYYCSRHGLFCYENEQKKRTGSGLTAKLSAFARAYVGENPIFVDTMAKKLLSEREYNEIEGYITSAGHEAAEYVNNYLAPTPVARARFSEDAVKNEIRCGAEQYVIIGSGLDTFALRNSGIAVFEIDKPECIRDKKSRIRRTGMEFPKDLKMISADLSKDSLSDALVRNGFDKKKKTVFACMGLLYYLTKDEISRLFEEISQLSADGSAVIFDFADNHLFSSDIDRVKNMVVMAETSGEPMKSCFGYGELERLLEEYNFRIYEFLNSDEINERYFSDCDTMTAFEHINYALAVKK